MDARLYLLTYSLTMFNADALHVSAVISQCIKPQVRCTPRLGKSAYVSSIFLLCCESIRVQKML